MKNRRAPLLAVAALWLAPASARAEGPLAGNWRQGALRETFTVHRWYPGCGPPPASGDTGGGETIKVHEEGDELGFVGGGRSYRTNQCYDQLPTLVRESHTVDPSGRSWRTKCVTPPADPRRAQMNAFVLATSDTHIELTETGRYEIKLAEGTCTADVKRSRTFDLIVPPTTAATAAPPAPVTPPEPKRPEPLTTDACAAPGDPARLEVRPSRKLMRTGETFQFRAIVRDAAGCLTLTPTSWSAPGSADGLKRGTVGPSGKVTVPADAPEGHLEIVATAAGRSTRVVVDVASPVNYDALLAASGLDKTGENDAAAVVQIEGASIGAGDARVEDGRGRRRNVFLVIVGIVVIALGGVALHFTRRSRKAAHLEAEAEERHAEELREAEERKRQREAEHSTQMKAHEESVHRAQFAADQARAARAAAARAAPRATAPDRQCPSCGREYGGDTGFCPADGSALAPRTAKPVAAPPAPTVARPTGMAGSNSSSMPLPSRGKICPTCGGRFEGAATFCGKDGTALVLLN